MLTAVRFYTCLLDDKISVPEFLFFSFCSLSLKTSTRLRGRSTTASQPRLRGLSPRPIPADLGKPSGTHLRMSGGKACGKQAAQYTGKQPDEVSVVTRRGAAAAWDMQETAANQGHREVHQHTAAAENEVHSSGHTHRKSKRTRTTKQATQTQSLLLGADAPFAAALEAIPAED